MEEAREAVMSSLGVLDKWSCYRLARSAARYPTLHCREACRDAQISIGYLAILVRAPDSTSGRHEFESPMRRELGALTKSGKTLGVRSFYKINKKYQCSGLPSVI